MKEKIDQHCGNLVKIFMLRQKEDLELKNSYILEIENQVNFELHKHEIKMKEFYIQKKTRH